jgi:hypothetical protein
MSGDVREQMPDVKGELIEHSEREEKLIRRLGRAVALQWGHLPRSVQKRILQQAWAVFDSEPVPEELKQELQAFVEQHQLPPRRPNRAQPADDEMKARAIDRWNNEGGAAARVEKSHDRGRSRRRV